MFLVHSTAKPPKSAPLVTPDRLAQLSSRGARITDETWKNGDGTEARGWLLRGSPGHPVIILLHRYGTDRSHLLNFGVKLNETTDFTVLMPDLRGHGLDPLTGRTTFGGCEVDDVQSAITFARSIKASDGDSLVGEEIGIFGVELGALAALAAAKKDPSIKALALESIPDSSDDMLAAAVSSRYSFGSVITSPLAKAGAYVYFAGGCYERNLACDLASGVGDRKVMLLAGPGAPRFQTSTSNLSSCFAAKTKVQAFTDLAPSGYDLTSATLKQADFYDSRVIYFFKESFSD